MFMPRAAGAILLAFALFNAALGWNRDELAWALSAVLLLVSAGALIVARPSSRALVFGAAAAAAVVGVISQVHAAMVLDQGVAQATAAWALWSSLWLATAYIGARYLPPPPASPRREPAQAPAAEDPGEDVLPLAIA